MQDIKTRKASLSATLTLLCVTGVSLYGCGGGKTDITNADKTNFAGGPQPPGYAAEAAKRRAAAEQNKPASFKAWQDKRNADLGHGNPPPNVPAIETPASH